MSIGRYVWPRDEDAMRNAYDKATTHNDPTSPWYDGPDEDDERERCEGCGKWAHLCICDEWENDWERNAA